MTPPLRQSAWVPWCCRVAANSAPSHCGADTQMCYVLCAMCHDPMQLRWPRGRGGGGAVSLWTLVLSKLKCTSETHTEFGSLWRGFRFTQFVDCKLQYAQNIHAQVAVIRSPSVKQLPRTHHTLAKREAVLWSSSCEFFSHRSMRVHGSHPKGQCKMRSSLVTQ